MDKKGLHKKACRASKDGKCIVQPVYTREQILKEMAKESKEREKRVANDFKMGFKFLDEIAKKKGKSVTVFGSTRFKEDHPFYKEAQAIGKMLASEGYSVVTGGAQGIMEAANRGAYEAGGESIGLNIDLPMEQHQNPYLNDSLDFNYFFSRKVFLAFATSAVIVCPGGFGTMDELFELLTLVQTKKIEPVPIILVGSKFWGDMIKFIKKRFVDEYKTISPSDMSIIKMADSAEEVRVILDKEVLKDLKEAFE